LTHPYDQEFRNTWDGEKSGALFLKAYFVFVCSNCEEVILYHWNETTMYHLVGEELESIFVEDVREELLEEESEFSLPYIVWPQSDDGSLSDSVAESVRKLYRTAFELKNKEPHLFAVQIRRALEAICIDQGEPGANLDTDLKSLSDAGVFPPIVAEIADELRLIGNAGVHIKPRKPRNIAEQVDVIDHFFHLVVNYVYEAPAKLRVYRKRLAPELPEIESEETIN